MPCAVSLGIALTWIGELDRLWEETLVDLSPAVSRHRLFA